MSTRTAVVTGASRGLGYALTTELVARGWHVVADGRDAATLGAALDHLGDAVTIVAGDVTAAEHRRRLIAAADAHGGIDLLVNNAGGLGPSPLPPLAEYPLDALRDLFDVNVVAPLALVQLALPSLGARHGTIVDITSDASVEPYEGWGGYGATKAALDHLGRVLAAEQDAVRVLTIDPGDLRTQMHQDAFPGEDISDRPEPATVVPALLALVEGSTPSGRHRAADAVAEVAR